MHNIREILVFPKDKDFMWPLTYNSQDLCGRNEKLIYYVDYCHCFLPLIMIPSVHRGDL